MITARDAQIFALNSVTTSIIAIQTVIPPSRVNIHSPALPKLTRFQKFRQSAWAHNPWHNPACCCCWLSFWSWSFRKIQKHFSFFYLNLFHLSLSSFFTKRFSNHQTEKKTTFSLTSKVTLFFTRFAFSLATTIINCFANFLFDDFVVTLIANLLLLLLGWWWARKKKKNTIFTNRTLVLPGWYHTPSYLPSSVVHTTSSVRLVSLVASPLAWEGGTFTSGQKQSAARIGLRADRHKQVRQ